MRHRLLPLPLVCAALVLTVAGLGVGAASALAAPLTEPYYFQGRTVEANTGAGGIFDASAALLEQASPLYII